MSTGAYWWGQGKRFAYVKATEGTCYRNPYFAQQYNGSYNVGMIRGAYHFATPTAPRRRAGQLLRQQRRRLVAGRQDAARRARHRVQPVRRHLLRADQAAMVSWIRDFLNPYKARTGRDAVIYTTTGWWTPCTGNTTAFSATNPLWVARYARTPGTLPAGWRVYTFWQYTSTPDRPEPLQRRPDRLVALAHG